MQINSDNEQNLKPTEVENIFFPYYGLQGLVPICDEKDLYMKWYSEDNKALAFFICQGKFRGVWVYIKRDSIVIDKDKVNFNKEIITNPNNLSDDDFQEDEFVQLLVIAMNDVVMELINWMNQKETEQ